MDRRKFLTISGTALAAGMFSFAFQNATFEGLEARTLPGIGEVGHYSGEKRRIEDDRWLDEHLDVEAFVGACARCGVCADVCPFKAIRFDGVFFPQVTGGTRRKCPGIDHCGLCLSNCPTDAIKQAYRKLPAEQRTPAAEQKGWYEGPSSEAERDLLGLK